MTKGLSEENCSEAECMEALQITRTEIKAHPMLLEQLMPFAGPQCFPHLTVRRRIEANEKDDGSSKVVGSSDVQSGKSHGVLDDTCWMQCMNPECGRWRCVTRNCRSVLQGTSYRRIEDTDLDWETWLQDAGQRYNVARSKAGLVSSDASFGVERRFDEVDVG